jgi:isoaspartyl peptidase/L-asparaginase-like protein (Ntn-hydrolase superfamily)
MASREPLIVSTWSFAVRGHAAAWPGLAAGGSALDAVEECCRVIDAAPDIDSVGFGGLPDADGRVSLDGCVMLAPNRCGSVAVLREHLHPVSVARRVMERTSHVMLAGPDADRFADAQDFPRQELLAPDARKAWEEWKRNPAPVNQGRDRGLRPIDSGHGSDGRLFVSDEARWKHHDTIGTLAIAAAGTMAGACSTSGTPYKLPGRIGDSPIIGHGLYVDPAAGGATATGVGELVMGICGSFLAVELLRQGRTPLEAATAVIERIRDSFTLEPHHQLAVIAVRNDGAHAGAALRPGFRLAVHDSAGSRTEEPGRTLLPE